MGDKGFLGRSLGAPLLLAALVGLVLVLGVTASLLVYSAAERVAQSNLALTETHIPRVRLVSEFRSELLEHERLAYELYALIDAEQMKPAIKAQRQQVAGRLPRLSAMLEPGPRESLENRWRSIVQEVDRLAANIARETTDWDAARAQLGRISEHRQAVDPLLEALAADAQRRAEAAEERSRDDLTFMSSLVSAYSAVILLIAFAVAWMLRHLFRANARNYALAQFPERNPMPVLTLDGRGQVQYANRAARHCVADDAGQGSPLAALVPPEVSNQIVATTMSSPAGRVEHAIGETLLSYHWYWLEDRQLYHVYVRDITAEREAQRELERMAFADEVTGLPNRNAMLARLREDAGQGAPRCLGVLNIERFYLLMVSQGFGAADGILARFAEIARVRVVELFGPDAVLARIEGAMFALYWQTAGQEGPALELDLDCLMDRLPGVIRSGRAMFHGNYRMGVRVVTAADEASPEELFSDADAALRQVEQNISGRYLIHDAHIREQQQHILLIEQRLREAMADEVSGLEVCLQPKISLRDYSVVGAEALLRWEDPDLGLMRPDRFVPIAEQSALILELGQWVTHRVLRLLQRWLEDPVLAQLQIAINAAPEELQAEHYGEGILQRLNQAGIPPQRLEIEVTERVLADTRAMGRMDNLGRLRRAGVEISLDDFGTGYSSLGYLSSMPISHLKIDKSFVNQIPSTDGPALVEVILGLARQIGIDCIAEGVETAEQARYLPSVGCFLAQGHYFAPALTIPEFEAFVRQQGEPNAPARMDGPGEESSGVDRE